MDERDPGPDSTDPMSGGFDRLSAAERDEVYAQIDRVVSVRPLDAGQFAYVPRRRGFVLPLVVNGIAVALIVAAALVLTDVFATAPDATVDASGAPITAEATLLDQFRRETDLRLDEQEREIDRIRTELAALAGSQGDLDADGRADAERRARALEAALEAALAAEEALRAQSATAADLDRAELESRLAEQLSVLYRAAGAALSAGRSADARAALGGVESLLASPLAVSLSLADRRAGVDALLVETLRGYAAVLEEPRADTVAGPAGDAADAEREAEVADLRAEIEAARRDLEAGRQEIARLESALRAARSSLDDRSTTAATQTAELSRLRDRVATLQEELSATRATVATQEQELSRLGRDLAAAERTIAARDAALRTATESAAAVAAERARRAELLVPVRRAVDGSIADAPRDREALFVSLQLKVRVLEALRLDAVLARYPGIDRDLETYLDGLSEEQRTLGRSEAIADIDRLLIDLRAGRTPDHAALAARYRIEAASALRALLDSLDPLLR